MPWQYVQDTRYVDSVPEDSGTHPAPVVMSATCTVQIRLNTTAEIYIQKADGCQITSVNQTFAMPHNKTAVQTMNNVIRLIKQKTQEKFSQEAITSSNKTQWQKH
jgi:hypothetical protein